MRKLYTLTSICFYLISILSLAGLWLGTDHTSMIEIWITALSFCFGFMFEEIAKATK